MNSSEGKTMAKKTMKTEEAIMHQELSKYHCMHTDQVYDRK